MIPGLSCCVDKAKAGRSITAVEGVAFLGRQSGGLRLFLEHLPFDDEGRALLGRVRRQRYGFLESTDALRIVAYLDLAGLARQDGFFRIGRNGAAAASLGVLDHQGLGTRVLKIEDAIGVGALLDLSVIDGSGFKFHRGAGDGFSDRGGLGGAFLLRQGQRRNGDQKREYCYQFFHFDSRFLVDLDIDTKIDQLKTKKKFSTP